MSEKIRDFVNKINTYKFVYDNKLLNFDKSSMVHWNEFQQSWNNLCVDNYMADNGKYRERRYSVFLWNKDTSLLELKPNEPHYQSLFYNSLNGGVERYYEMFEELTIANDCFKSIMHFAIDVINELSPNSSWHIEAHQFRIKPQNSLAKPTPEGIHRDGRDYIIMVLINRENIVGGVSSIYDTNGNVIKEITLTNPLETFMVCDNSTMHGVSPIESADKNLDSYRDMLVITFINQDKLK